MAFKMKGSHHYGKGNTSPNKHYSVEKGSHNHPHGDSPNKFLGGALGKIGKGIGGALKGAIKGKDGKFGIGDVGRLAMGPLGAAAGATGLFAKKDQMQKETKKKEERNEYGETRAEYIKRMEEMGLRKPEKKKVPTKMYGKKK